MRNADAPLPACLTCLPGDGPIPIYHMTHMANLRAIIERGCLLCHNDCGAAKQAYVRIGDPEIKGKRSQATVRAHPHGSIGDYVPFYLAPRSPMLYVISKGRVEGFNGSERDIVYLVSSIEHVRDLGLAAVFTDGQANARISKHCGDLSLLAESVDWQVMRGQMWFDTPTQPDRKRRRQAEVLVHRRFPWNAVLGLAVAGKAALGQVQGLLAEFSCGQPVISRAGWFYGAAA